MLVFLLDFAACGNRKALRLRAQGVPPVNDKPECRKQRSECRMIQWSHRRASASKSEDFLEVVGLQTTFPTARLEGELVVLLAKDG